MYQHWKYNTGENVDFFRKHGKPKKNQRHNCGKNTRLSVQSQVDKFTKVNPVNMVAVVTTDDPEDPGDLTDKEGEIEEDTGSTQKLLEEPEDNLSSPRVSNNTDTIFPWGDSQYSPLTNYRK